MAYFPSPASTAGALLLAGLCALPAMARADTLLLDTFSDDTPGLAPNGAEIGDAYYHGVAGQAGANVLEEVFDDSGNRRLRVTSPLPGGEASGGLVEYFPIANPSRFSVDYLFRIEGNSDLVGGNSFGQELVLAPLGTNLELLWSASRELVVGVSAPGDTFFTQTGTGFHFDLDVDYAIQWEVNATLGVFSILANGASVLSGAVMPGPVAGLSELAFFNNFDTTGSQIIDDVRIAAVPEPETYTLMLAGLGLLTGLARARATTATER